MGAALGGFMPCFERWWMFVARLITIFNVHDHSYPARCATSFFAAAVFLVDLGHPSSDGIKNQDAVITERDFLGLPWGFVAVMGILPVEAN